MPEFRPDLDYIREIWPTLSDAERREFYRQYQAEASPARARADVATVPAAAADVATFIPNRLAGAGIELVSGLGRMVQSAGKAAGVVPGESEPFSISNPFQSKTPFYDEYVRRVGTQYPMANVPYEAFDRKFAPPAPPPAPPAPPPAAEGEREGEGAPTPAPARPSGAAGIPPLRMKEIGFLMDPEKRAAMVQSGVEKRLAEVGEYKAPEKTMLDSPYSALITAGLGMLMGGAGKSPLEAIASGGQAGMQAAKEIATRQEARAEKEYGRKVDRLRLRTDLERSAADLAFKAEDLNAKYLHLENERRKGLSDAAYQQRKLVLDEEQNRIRSRANDISEYRAGMMEKGQIISSLTSELRNIDTLKEKASQSGDDRRLAQLDREARGLRARLRQLQGESPAPRPSANQAIGIPND